MIRLDDMTVLLVDDERDTRETVRMALAARGAAVEAAGSAQEARQMMRNFDPTAVVSDLMMPVEDGYRFIESVRALGTPASRVPFIALSAFGTPLDRRRAKRAGYAGYLVKPATPDQLASAIHEAMRAAAGDDDSTSAAVSAGPASSGPRSARADSAAHRAAAGTALAINLALLSYHRSPSGAVRVEMPGGRVVATFEPLGLGKDEWRVTRAPGGLAVEDAQRAFAEWTSSGCRLD